MTKVKPDRNDCRCHEMRKFSQEDSVPEPLLQLCGGWQLLHDALLHPLFRFLREVLSYLWICWWLFSTYHAGFFFTYTYIHRQLSEQQIGIPGGDRGTHSQRSASYPSPYQPPISTWSSAKDQFQWEKMMFTFVFGPRLPTPPHSYCLDWPQTWSWSCLTLLGLSFRCRVAKTLQRVTLLAPSISEKWSIFTHQKLLACSTIQMSMLI